MVTLFWGLLLHGWGDYVIQTHRMAEAKTSSWTWAGAHALTYTLPFLLITHSLVALLVIGGTHAVIDRYRLAKPFIWAKERFTGGHKYSWAVCRENSGFAPGVPPFMAVWLMIVVDNIWHVTINSLALQYL